MPPHHFLLENAMLGTRTQIIVQKELSSHPGPTLTWRLGQVIYLSKPQFPHLWCDHNSTFLSALLSENFQGKCLAQCQAQYSPLAISAAATLDVAPLTGFSAAQPLFSPMTWLYETERAISRTQILTPQMTKDVPYPNIRVRRKCTSL
jgi:hypothetical protein